MKKTLYYAIALALALSAAAAHAALNVFSCEPEWQALAQELGGEKISAYPAATSAMQDPHHIQARPSLIARIRNADLLVCTGAELEIGWLPVLLRQSGNPRIQPGTRGYLEASAYVQRLEVPSRVDRAEGDIHPQGNPHIQTDPRNIALVAEVLGQRLAELDPADAGYFRARHAAFADKWRQAIQRWESEAAPLKGMTIVAHHKEWVYLNRWLGLKELAELEPKPGVEPTASHLEELLTTLQHDPAQAVVRSAYQDPKASDWLAQRAHIPAVMLPYTVGGTPEAKDLYALFDDTIARLKKVAGH
ncbi:MAG TPA: zinc ABC transporter substrate-binding protein [Burkholderiales bacterium]|nr:zinc ABC transporter substrate-binding protein [Burkholderiales bacterium]